MNRKMNKCLSSHHCRVVVTFFLIAALYLGLLPNMPSNIVRADHVFAESTGIYRIPYFDGVDLRVQHDTHTHGGTNVFGKGKYDLIATGTSKKIAAAASGWIRVIVDNHGNSPNPGDNRDSNGLTHDNVPEPDTIEIYNDSREHSCANNPEGSKALADCVAYNNYVWIEHPNGEWSHYTHMGTGTVTALGWTADPDPDNREVGAAYWIEAGEELGLEGDVGFAGSGDLVTPAPHLHWEVAVPLTVGGTVGFEPKGGFLTGGTNRKPLICGIGPSGTPGILDQNETFTAGPCTNQLPSAEAGGPYEVNEGSTVQLNGTGSTDPDGNPLTYMWSPATNLNDGGSRSPQPTYTGVDDSTNTIRLDVFDKIEQTNANDTATITVKNVPPTVNATGSSINEGASATVSATVTDPGTADILTATINWDDGSPVQNVTVAQLNAGVTHVYGDNGTFNVVVSASDDDGGADSDSATVTVGNLDPTLSLDTSGAISFPGGDYLIVEAGTQLPSSATGTDPGSDDLTFTWNAGDVNIFYNNGTSPDPAKSPFGTFPFTASDSIDALYGAPGVETLSLTLSDDDGGSDVNSAGVIVTGNATVTEGSGWWKHQYSEAGSPHINAATAMGYLEIVNAVSSVFSETITTATMAHVHAVLSPTEGDRRARARAELMVAWLQFASGAVAYDATVPLDSGPTDFLVLMFGAEAVINDPASTDAQLHAAELDLAKVRHAN